LQNTTHSTVSTNQQQQLPVNFEDNNRSVNHQVIAKSTDGSTKEENYHMIPIDSISNKDNNDEQQSNIKEENNSPENSSKEITHDKPSVKRTTSNEEYV
jgi:hypothetical protein